MSASGRNELVRALDKFDKDSQLDRNLLTALFHSFMSPSPGSPGWKEFLEDLKNKPLAGLSLEKFYNEPNFETQIAEHEQYLFYAFCEVLLDAMESPESHVQKLKAAQVQVGESSPIGGEPEVLSLDNEEALNAI